MDEAAIRAKIKVSDPFNAAADAELPSLRLALAPVEARAEFVHALPRLATEQGRVHVRAIRVVRHKPGRRCVIEYDVKVMPPNAPIERETLVGKVRARRYGNEGYRLLDAIWNAGFDDASSDGFSVPEAIGVIPRFRMWLQRKVPGTVAGTLLAGSDGVALARRMAEAIHKLHRAGVPADRRHTMADELRILRECLSLVRQTAPAWAKRIERITNGCGKLGTSVPEPRPCGIHRDFYPAQVIVNGSRLHLIDFDLYCLGDPALDVGNFIGHMTEESLRTFGDADALRDRETAMEARFLELSGHATRAAVRAYTTLTLARHIYLSTQFSERRSFTEQLMELCEERLDLGESSG